MKIEIQEATSARMPAGKYWFGDPCYMNDHKNPVHEEQWDKFVEVMFPESHGGKDGPGIESGIATWGDHSFFYSSTAYGDGSFFAHAHGTRSKKVGVDAGMLALVPWSLVEKMFEDRPEKLEEFAEDGLVIEKFGDIVRVAGGSWVDGIHCDTDPQDDEEEDDSYGYDEDEDQDEYEDVE